MQDNDDRRSQPQAKRSRKINGLVILMLTVAALVVLTYRPSIEPVYCDEAAREQAPDVIMLGTRWCPYCYQARRYLTDNDIDYCEYDIENSAHGEKLFNDVNGRSIPVLLIGDAVVRGFDEGKLDQLLSTIRQES